MKQQSSITVTVYRLLTKENKRLFSVSICSKQLGCFLFMEFQKRGDMDMKTWRWRHGHGNMEMETWRWSHGDRGMET
jgi:hypothetical protein